MKKFLVILLISVFFVPALAFAVEATSEQGFERILSPDQIRNFEKIKKDGRDLFGVRRGSSTDQFGRPGKNKQDVGTTSTSTLEKISHPQEVNLFEKIKKIGSALWGIRKGWAKKPALVKPVAVQCVKDAITKKDTALKTNIASSSQREIAAIDTRNTCQKLSLDKTTGEEQFEANKICVKTFQTEIQAIRKTVQQDRNETWKDFQTDLKTCSALQRENASSSSSTRMNSEASDEIKIEDGGNED